LPVTVLLFAAGGAGAAWVVLLPSGDYGTLSRLRRASFMRVGRQLEAAGIVRSRTARLSAGEAGTLKAGEYRFDHRHGQRSL